MTIREVLIAFFVLLAIFDAWAFWCFSQETQDAIELPPHVHPIRSVRVPRDL